MTLGQKFPQLQGILYATAISLAVSGLIYLLRIFIPINIPGLTYLVVGISCFTISLKSNLKPIFAWTVGYIFSWVFLIFIYQSETNLTPFLFIPLPSAISAVIGSLIGTAIKKSRN